MLFSPATMASRRRRNSFTITSTSSCGPCSAASPARCVKLAVHEFELTISRSTACDQPRREHAVAEAPAGHRVGLREAVEDHRLLEHAVELRDRLRLLARRRCASRSRRSGRSGRGRAPDRRCASGRPSGSRRRSGLRRRVQDDQLRLRREALLERVEVEREAALLDQRHRHAHWRRGNRPAIRRSGIRGWGRSPRRRARGAPSSGST